MESSSGFVPRIISAGPGLDLRPVTVSDAPELYRMIDRNRAMLAEWLPWATPDYSETRLSSFLAEREAENISRAALTAAICVDGGICGSIAIHQIDQVRSNASLGYWLDLQHMGKGIATRACRALITEAFAEYHLHRVEIRCAAGNDRSAAIPLRLGFREEGVLREAEQLHGKFFDLRLFGMLRHEWPSVRNEGQ